MNKHDKDIKECLKAAGVQLNEFFNYYSKLKILPFIIMQTRSQIFKIT